MSVEYDNYYQTANLFGEAYPELIAFYSTIKNKGKLLDLGCGQGRDALALAKLGYIVTGIDNSKVGIEQLNQIAKSEGLQLEGLVEDIYSYADFDKFDFILLDSMFHFGKKERDKETKFLNQILAQAKHGAFITICIQKTGNKLETLNSIIKGKNDLSLVHKIELIYKYEDKESNHSSKSKYEMITLEKM